MIEGGNTVPVSSTGLVPPDRHAGLRVVQERGEARHNGATFAGWPSADMYGAWGGQLIEYIPSLC
jgi:hypothetical protein